MRRAAVAWGLVAGALVTASAMGVTYLAQELAGLPFPPYDLFGAMTRELPGPVVTFGIDVMIDGLLLVGLSVADTAKTAERAIALLQFVLWGMAAGGIYYFAACHLGPRPGLWAGVGTGALVGTALSAVNVEIGGAEAHPVAVVVWLVLVFAVWGVALNTTFVRLVPRTNEPIPSGVRAETGRTITRRRFVVKLGAVTATITIASTALGRLLSDAARRQLEAEFRESPEGRRPGSGQASLLNADDPVIPAPGTRPEYTPVEDHYTVFIRLDPAVIDGPSWSLPVTGLVANPLSLSIQDLRDKFEARSQFVTLSCISNRVGGELIGTTHWTGVSVQDVLAQVQPGADARYLDISSRDGFHETVALDLIRSDARIMLCYEWDGRPLPIDHGFPLRIWIPDRYGMKQPKWIESIKVTEDDRRGYWVRRGWDPVARVDATSVVDTVEVADSYSIDGQTFVPIGGIAFAGARGVSRVELRVNDGPWQEARLRKPLSETTWLVWRYDWQFAPGDYVFEVRCLEGDGTPQIEKSRDTRPAGATGLHSRRRRY